jgi:peptidoglycan/LPS O-acetylase OafA/YrhL
MTSPYLRERPNGDISAADTIAGLLFIQDSFLNQVQNFAKLKPLENTFWSLYVEIKFYILFGALYFANTRTALRNLICLFLLSFFYVIFTKLYFFRHSKVIEVLFFDVLQLRFFGWFCVGALLYRAHSTSSFALKLGSIVLMFPTITIMFGRDPEYLFASFGIFLVFFGCIQSHLIAQVFRNKVLLFMGFISYPLYLVHENAMIALTIKVHKNFPILPDLSTPIPGILVISLFAFAIASVLEPATRALIRRCITTI